MIGASNRASVAVLLVTGLVVLGCQQQPVEQQPVDPDFSVLAQPTPMGPRHFPLSGLHDLDPDFQEWVLELLVKPPVSQVLTVAAYSASASETVSSHRSSSSGNATNRVRSVCCCSRSSYCC